jgi:FkbM family methyltransferase
MAIAGEYLRRTPIEYGKWRVADFLKNRLAQKPVRGVKKVTGGIVMDHNTSDFLQREIYVHRDFEPNIRTEIQKRLRRGDQFLDIGANVGFYSLHAAKTVGANGTVYAFEPAPETRKALERNLLLNGIRNVIPVAVALSNSIGRSELFLDARNNSGASSLRKSPNSGGSVEVELDTYDNYAARNGLSVPALVKIDVEGAEVKVLRGMHDLLSRSDRPAVILEVSEWSLKQMGSSKEELFEFMIQHRYKARLLSRPGVSIFSEDNIFFQYDVLFTPIAN